MSILLEKRLEESRRDIAVTVACAVPKRPRMERVVEKLTEIGVEAILPLSAERTIPRMKGEEEAKKVLRFRKIAAQTAKQCGVSRLPEISKIFSFTEVLGLSRAYDLALFLDPEGRPLQECLKGKIAKRVIVAVGPEGGWSERELEEAGKMGWEPASLGKYILKVDTACLAAVAILHYALDPLEK